MDRFIGTRIHLFLSLALFPALAMAQLPDPGLTIDPQRTALVITDPQNDFLSPKANTGKILRRKRVHTRIYTAIEQNYF